VSTIEKKINEYLFWEFGLDLKSDPDRISTDWPFKLRLLPGGKRLVVFEFIDGEEGYFATAKPDFMFYRKAGMTVEDLIVQEEGSTWIGARDPIGLEMSRLGDSLVPSSLERRVRIEQLATEALGVDSCEILEGVFLRKESSYLALARATGTDAYVVGLPDTVVSVPFPEASPGRRLAWGVGCWLKGTSDDQG